MLVVSFCKQVVLKLKLLVGGKPEYYKPMGGNTKKGGPSFEILVGRANGGARFSTQNLFGGKILKKTMVYFWKYLHQKHLYKLYLNNTMYTIFMHKNESKITPYEEKNIFSRLL